MRCLNSCDLRSQRKDASNSRKSTHVSRSQALIDHPLVVLTCILTHPLRWSKKWRPSKLVRSRIEWKRSTLAPTSNSTGVKIGLQSLLCSAICLWLCAVWYRYMSRCSSLSIHGCKSSYLPKLVLFTSFTLDLQSLTIALREIHWIFWMKDSYLWLSTWWCSWTVNWLILTNTCMSIRTLRTSLLSTGLSLPAQSLSLYSKTCAGSLGSAMPNFRSNKALRIRTISLKLGILRSSTTKEANLRESSKFPWSSKNTRLKMRLQTRVLTRSLSRSNMTLLRPLRPNLRVSALVPTSSINRQRSVKTTGTLSSAPLSAWSDTRIVARTIAVRASRWWLMIIAGPKMKRRRRCHPEALLAALSYPISIQCT